MTTDKDMRNLAVEIICFVQHGRFYNGKVDDKVVDEVANRLMWGPATAWWTEDRALFRQWMAARKPSTIPTLPRPLAPPTLPRPVLAPPTLPRPLAAPPQLPRPLAPLAPPTLPRK